MKQKNCIFILFPLLLRIVTFFWLIQFPGLSSRVYGEENNHFENKLGQSITVKVGADMKETTNMLIKILNGNNQIANLLARIIYHSNHSGQSFQRMDITNTNITDIYLEQNDIGIWIDPIGINEIHGHNSSTVAAAVVN